MNKKKNDMILAGGLLGAAAVLGLVFWQGYGGPREEAAVVVKVDGAVYRECSLWEEQTLTIETGSDQYNILEIRDGQADMTEASCPDRLCVEQKEISRQGEMLVCLPNKVTVEIRRGGQGEVDAVAD